MVSIQAIRESNAHIATSLPPGLVAVFVGATSGIGETSLRQFAKNARRPRIYFLGRREAEGRRIQGELEELNPDGEYHYLKCDVSLLENVDDACRHLRDREPAINLLFLSCGTLITGKQTDEGLHYPMAVAYYARTRFVVNLLPQLRRAAALRRVVTVLAGGKEGPVSADDFPANHVGVLSFRGHATSLLTLSLQAAARTAPEVSFVHVYPGFVATNMSRELTGVAVAAARVLFRPVMALLQIPIVEVGERHAYLATSARFPPRDRGGADVAAADGVPLGEGMGVAVGADGAPGGGVYSVDYEAEGTSAGTQEVLGRLAEDGTAEKAWKHTEEEFVRIRGSPTL